MDGENKIHNLNPKQKLNPEEDGAHNHQQMIILQTAHKTNRLPGGVINKKILQIDNRMRDRPLLPIIKVAFLVERKGIARQIALQLVPRAAGQTQELVIIVERMDILVRIAPSQNSLGIIVLAPLGKFSVAIVILL